MKACEQESPGENVQYKNLFTEVRSSRKIFLRYEMSIWLTRPLVEEFHEKSLTLFFFSFWKRSSSPLEEVSKNLKVSKNRKSHSVNVFKTCYRAFI